MKRLLPIVMAALLPPVFASCDAAGFLALKRASVPVHSVQRWYVVRGDLTIELAADVTGLDRSSSYVIYPTARVEAASVHIKVFATPGVEVGPPRTQVVLKSLEPRTYRVIDDHDGRVLGDIDTSKVEGTLLNPVAP